jgi:hypothetical protein
MNNIAYKNPITGLYFYMKAYQGKAVLYGNKSVAHLDRWMLRNNFVRAKGGAA